MSPIRGVRMTLYGFTLAFGLIQNVIAILLFILATDEYYEDDPIHILFYFGIVAAILALLTWIWASVLLAYNNKPRWNHPFTLAFPHLLSYGIMAVVWLASGIMLLSQLGKVCRSTYDPFYDPPYEWCIFTALTGGLSMSLWLLTTAASLSILWTIRKSGNMWCKIVSQDGDLQLDERAYGRAPRTAAIRTTIYVFILILGLAQSPTSGMVALAFNNVEAQRAIYSTVAATASMLTWIWMAVLLSYNRRPASKRGICRTSTHFYSLVIVSLAWLAVAVLVTIEARLTIRIPNGDEITINVPRYPRFTALIPNIAFSWTLFLLTLGAAFYIYWTVKKAGGTLGNSNVAQYDGDSTANAAESEMLAVGDTGHASRSTVNVLPPNVPQV